jgi:hypothetical protein
VKYERRTSARPGRRAFTHSAIRSASAIEVGMVPSANQKLFLRTCQNTGSSASAA